MKISKLVRLIEKIAIGQIEESDYSKLHQQYRRKRAKLAVLLKCVNQDRDLCFNSEGLIVLDNGIAFEEDCDVLAELIQQIEKILTEVQNAS